MKQKYSKQQMSFLREKYKTINRCNLTNEFNARFGLNESVKQIVYLLKKYKIKSGRSGYFKKGQKTWNAGTKGQGLTGANSTSFKKGHRPANTKKNGHERFDARDGFILIKIKERNPYTGCPTRYEHKHVHIWKQKHGHVPAGMIVAFKNGNRLNCNINNLMLLNRAELLYLNKRNYKNLHNDLKPSMVMLAKLKIKIGKRLKAA